MSEIEIIKLISEELRKPQDERSVDVLKFLNDQLNEIRNKIGLGTAGVTTGIFYLIYISMVVCYFICFLVMQFYLLPDNFSL
mmetsp:Transcript_10474/g.9401  ORF Transcript_10474/g.9401 Transcript_10474/m.9401 type:complete len:82 (+) Transcript_10474:57-302(+)